MAISPFAVGIDIELIRDHFDFNSLGPTIFSKDEAEFIASSQYKLETFFTIWTRKEAILKATGEGLVDDLRSVNCIGRSLFRGERSYELNSFLIEEDYVASIAINNIDANQIMFIDV